MSPKDATNAEIKYWVTSGSLANGFNERTLIQQFNIEKYDASGIMLRTCMQGGTTHDSEQELINSLRYGLLSWNGLYLKKTSKATCFTSWENMLNQSKSVMA